MKAGTMVVVRSSAVFVISIAVFCLLLHLSLVTVSAHPMKVEKLRRKLVNEDDNLLNYENDRCTTIIVGAKAGSEGGHSHDFMSSSFICILHVHKQKDSLLLPPTYTYIYR